MTCKNYLDYIKEYGIICFLFSLLSLLFPLSSKGARWRWWIQQHKHKVIIQYLTNHYYSYITKEGQNEKGTGRNQECIWTAWLQGEDNAPEVIKLTLASIRKNSNKHRVIVLTNENINQYIEIPELIKQKHDAGIIGNAHFADVVRMMILAKYGGIWLDATAFLHEPIEENAFSSSFYSVGFKAGETRFVSGHKWLIGVIGGYKNSEYLTSISNMLLSYWKDHSIPIDYFVFDYLITILYRNDSSFRHKIDELPRMEYFTSKLRKTINEPYNEDELAQLLAKQQIYILSYKYKYIKTTSKGEKTYYGKLCEELLSEYKYEGN